VSKTIVHQNAKYRLVIRTSFLAGIFFWNGGEAADVAERMVTTSVRVRRLGQFDVPARRLPHQRGRRNPSSSPLVASRSSPVVSLFVHGPPSLGCDGGEDLRSLGGERRDPTRVSREHEIPFTSSPVELSKGPLRCDAEFEMMECEAWNRASRRWLQVSQSSFVSAPNHIEAVGDDDRALSRLCAGVASA